MRKRKKRDFKLLLPLHPNKEYISVREKERRRSRS
jgi:hypothetical protein